MVLPVPGWQGLQILPDGVEEWNLLRVEELRDVRLRVFVLEDVLALGMQDDAVLCFLCQRAVAGRGFVLVFEGYEMILLSGVQRYNIACAVCKLLR